MSSKVRIRQVIKAGESYDALYSSVYVGTYPSKAQAEAALKGGSGLPPTASPKLKGASQRNQICR